MARWNKTEGQKTDWDVRAWRLGLILSNILGPIFALCFEATREVRFVHLSEQLRLEILGLAGVFILIVLPAILAGIARRRWLAWAYLPCAVLAFWLYVMILVGTLMRGKGISISSISINLSQISALLIRLSIPFASALPVCAARLLILRNRVKLAARLAFEQSQFTMERVGVWPPPPTPPSSSSVSETEPSGNTKYT